MLIFYDYKMTIIVYKIAITASRSMRATQKTYIYIHTYIYICIYIWVDIYLLKAYAITHQSKSMHVFILDADILPCVVPNNSSFLLIISIISIPLRLGDAYMRRKQPVVCKDVDYCKFHWHSSEENFKRYTQSHYTQKLAWTSLIGDFIHIWVH